MGIFRLLLALSVVAVHCGVVWKFKLVGGQIAVQSFYIISGFYMTLILNEKYNRGKNSLKLFLSNRFLRLYPIYWAVLIATVIVCLSIGVLTDWRDVPKFNFYKSVEYNPLTFGTLAFTNLLIFGQDVIMFMGIIPETGQLYFTKNFLTSSPRLYDFLFIEQAWTLGIELLFYCIAPFIVRRSKVFLVSLFLLTITLRFSLYHLYDLKHDPWTYRFFPTELTFFLLGSFSYHIYLWVKKQVISSRLSILVFVFLIGITIMYSWLPSVKLSILPFSLKEIFYFGLVSCSIPVLFNYFKNIKLDIQLGELSYPVYISHMLVALVLRYVVSEEWQQGWVAAFFTIILSLVLNKYISNPIEKYRQMRILSFNKKGNEMIKTK